MNHATTLKDLLAKEYDVHYGARSLQHAVDQQVVNRLAHGCSARLMSVCVSSEDGIGVMYLGRFTPSMLHDVIVQ
jgi:hypothetical protein